MEGIEIGRADKGEDGVKFIVQTLRSDSSDEVELGWGMGNQGKDRGGEGHYSIGGRGEKGRVMVTRPVF